MKPINCIIVDDEELDRRVLEGYVQDLPELHLCGSYANALESIDVIKSKSIDLIFMDIDMPVINGIDFLKKLDNPPLCIFITSHVDFALDAFELHAVDYVMKPVKKERFVLAVNRACELLSIRQKALTYDLKLEHETLIIKEGTIINRVKVDDIIYLEALTNYTKVITSGRKFITLKNLKNFLEDLPHEKFMRIHRSYVVAKGKINSLENGEVVLGSFKLPLGKTFRKIVASTIAAN